MKDDDKYLHDVDLHPNEWSREGSHVPFWGPAAKPMLILFLVGMVANVVATKLVTGATPYWFLPLLESVGLDGWAKLVSGG